MENKMANLDITVLRVGPLVVNCYLVGDPATGQGLLIDPGDDADEIIAAVREANLNVAGILLTHGHFDHIRGVPAVARACEAPVYLHPADQALYASPLNAMPPQIPPAENLPPPTSVPPVVPGLEFRILHTPGHTPGGVCFYFADQELLFSGDTLFAGSVGRTDFPGGNTDDLLRSIKQVLFPLPRAVTVYPGHFQPTTIGREIDSNPFVR
jgi:glyoxylase-like metal-dependent hydrolase (beta-lactamase superfamily II)